MQITAIILAGGKSRRMGTDKALLEIEGVSLLQRAIDLCKPVCNNIIISSNHAGHSRFDYPIFPDEIKDCGPLGGIYTCLKASVTEWNFVVSVDAAFIDNDFLAFLASEIGNYDAIVPFSEKGKEPLIALYNKSVLPQIEKMIAAEDYKMHNLIHAISTKWVDAGLWLRKRPRLFRNLNRPEDLDGLKI